MNDDIIPNVAEDERAALAALYNAVYDMLRAPSPERVEALARDAHEALTQLTTLRKETMRAARAPLDVSITRADFREYRIVQAVRNSRLPRSLKDKVLAALWRAANNPNVLMRTATSELSESFKWETTDEGYSFWHYAWLRMQD